MFWNNLEINNDYIIFPDIPISYDNDISLFGLFINFFSDLDLDYTINITPTIDEEITNIITNQKGTYFIQFAASESPVKSFKGIDGFNTYIRDGVIHYTLSDFSSLDAAEDKMHSIRALGYSDAFVFTFKNDKRVCFFIVESDDDLEEEIIIVEEETEIVEDVVKNPYKAVVKEVAIIPGKEVINEVAKIPVKEVIKDVAKIPAKDVVKEVTEIPTKKVVEEIVPIKNVSEVVVQSNITQNLDDDGYPVKSDVQVILDSPFIKENAKDLIFKSIENGTIFMNDVEKLLFKHVGEMIKKKHVKELIKSKI